jgi:N-hydroxyarylamine O-acetyltransferase
MLLKVNLEEGPYVTDVGFGGHLVASPLRLVMEEEQAAPASVLRYRQAEERIIVQVRLPNGWRNAYRFTFEPQAPIDYKVANWFTPTHPASRFRQGLLAERLTQEARHPAISEKRDHSLPVALPGVDHGSAV